MCVHLFSFLLCLSLQSLAHAISRVDCQDLSKGKVDGVIATLTNWLWTTARPPAVANILLYFGDDWALQVRYYRLTDMCRGDVVPVCGVWK